MTFRHTYTTSVIAIQWDGTAEGAWRIMQDLPQEGGVTVEVGYSSPRVLLNGVRLHVGDYILHSTPGGASILSEEAFDGWRRRLPGEPS